MALQHDRNSILNFLYIDMSLECNATAFNAIKTIWFLYEIFVKQSVNMGLVITPHCPSQRRYGRHHRNGSDGSKSLACQVRERNLDLATERFCLHMTSRSIEKHNRSGISAWAYRAQGSLVILICTRLGEKMQPILFLLVSL